MNSATANDMAVVQVGASGGIGFDYRAPFAVWNRYSDANAYWYIRGFGDGAAAADMIADGTYRTFSASIGVQDSVEAYIDGGKVAYNSKVYSKDNASRVRGDFLGVRMGEINKKARFDVRSVRVYSRRLQADEIAANKAVDDARFGGNPVLEAGETLYPAVPFSIVSTSDDSAVMTSATVVFQGSGKVRSLYVAWAGRDRGPDIADWPNAARLCDIPAGACRLDVDFAACGVSVPASSGIRFFVDSTSAADYVSDGLILLYDGVENAGWGVHDGAAVSWRNLVAADVNTGTDMPIGISGDSVGADAVSFAAQSRETSGALLSE